MPLPESIRANLPELTVTELSGAIKRTLEDAFGYVRLRAEVSNYRGPHSSGHVYFCLKDAGARIDAVIWKGVFGRLRFKPEEGMEVIATGRITTFPGKSTYQIVVEALEPAGIGALMALLDERRKKLTAEGLFDERRKQLLPFLPDVVGVVTSPTGAVIRDILHRLADRFPRRVIIWPVRVQGETSAAEVAAAIRGFDALPEGGPIPKPDVLIVARGGGSLEDLWSFNEEIVVRAAAECSIPLVSAVGHETDWTLIDLAADMRAPTPTAAAEMVVPVRAELAEQTAARVLRLAGALRRNFERARADLRSAARALPGAADLVAIPRQRLDLAGGRLSQALVVGLHRHETRFSALSRRLVVQNPQARLARVRDRLAHAGQRLARGLTHNTGRRSRALAPLAARLGTGLLRPRLARAGDRLERFGERLRAAAEIRLRRQRDHLAALGPRLENLSHRRVLARGFALVRDEERRILPSRAAVPPGAALAIEFADGEIGARAEGEGAAPRPKRSGTRQGSLF